VATPGRPLRSCDQGRSSPDVGYPRCRAWLKAQRETPEGGVMGVQRYTGRPGRCGTGLGSSRMALGRDAGFRAEGLMRWPGNRTSGGGFRSGEWIDPRRGQVPLVRGGADWLGLGARSSAGPVKAMRRRGGTTSRRVSATGRWARSQRRRCRPWVGSLVARGLAPSTADSVLSLRCGPSSRSRWLMPGCSPTWRPRFAIRPVAALGVRAMALTLGELGDLTEACKGRLP
jgi:hypothetical protein